MFDLLRVAIRNVGRNKRRSLITVITVFIGVVVVIGVRGILNGLQGEIRSGLTRKMHGDIQVHKAGYRHSLDANPYKILIPNLTGVTTELKSLPDVQEVAPRLRLMALINHQKTQTTTPVMIAGIDSVKELKVCPRLLDAVTEGSVLDSSTERMAKSVTDDLLEEAVPLDEAESSSVNEVRAVGYHQIMLTPPLMEGMDAAIGDEVVVMLQDKNGMQQALVAKIVGVIDYGMPTAAARMAWMDFTTLQKTLNLGDTASELALLINSKKDADTVIKSVRNYISDDLVAETWLDLGGFFRDVMGIQNAVFGIILMIMFTIVMSAIVNTSLMTVMERTKEIGTLMALGYRRVHLLFLFLAESSVIGLGGGIVGVVFSGAIIFYLNHVGIRLALPGQQVATTLFPWVSSSYILLVILLAVFSALFASLYPAYRASRMKPVEALSTN